MQTRRKTWSSASLALQEGLNHLATAGTTATAPIKDKSHSSTHLTYHQIPISFVLSATFAEELLPWSCWEHWKTQTRRRSPAKKC